MGSAASKGWNWPQSLDAVVAAPEHYRVILENDRVRVLEVRIPAGDKVPLHTHCWLSVLQQIQWADFIRRDEHGTVLTDTRNVPQSAKKPGFMWADPLTLHTVENIDTVEFVGIAVEIKMQI